MEVKAVQTSEELFAVCSLRYEVYVGELKRDNYAYTDNVRRVLEDPLDHEEGVINLYVPDATGQPIGVARVHVPFPHKYAEAFSLNDASIFPSEHESLSNFAFFSRFLIRQDCRGRRADGSSVSDYLYRAAFDVARHARAQFMGLNCTPALVSLYERKGFVRYRPCFCDEGMGLQVPMILPMEDLTFLSRVEPRGSFVTSLTLHPPSSPSVWLEQLLLTRPKCMISSKGLWESDVEFFTAAREHLHTGFPSLSAIPIFQGTTPEERGTFFLGTGPGCSVIDIREGDYLTRDGDVRDEAFLIIKGEVQVGVGADIQIAGPGDVLGEVSFLSSAKRQETSRAQSDVEVLVLSRMAFLKAMEACPKVTVRLLFNLSVMLARRYMALTSSVKAIMKAQEDDRARAEEHKLLSNDAPIRNSDMVDVQKGLLQQSEDEHDRWLARQRTEPPLLRKESVDVLKRTSSS